MKKYIDKNVNLSFAMDQFSKQTQVNKTMVDWVQALRMMIKVWKLQIFSCKVTYTAPQAAKDANKCVCNGGRYTKDVAIRDKIVEAMQTRR